MIALLKLNKAGEKREQRIRNFSEEFIGWPNPSKLTKAVQAPAQVEVSGQLAAQAPAQAEGPGCQAAKALAQEEAPGCQAVQAPAQAAAQMQQ